MSRRVVYGDFLDSESAVGRAISSLVGGAAEPQFAIEIVHEPSANQFVGKLYRRNAVVNWIPIDAGSLAGYTWYKQFQEKGQLLFQMQGSGPWAVLHFRVESDETGPYVAVALQYAKQPVAVGQ